jgi:putative endonuclease|tara:strand:- start:471 stop:1136 length:666 start_codon:yes stop_codon:yes gene_type:complete
MSDIIKHYIDKRLDESEYHVFEGYSTAFLENEYWDNNKHNDESRLNTVVKILQSFNDSSINGVIDKGDLHKITHFMTDKLWALNKSKVVKMEEERSELIDKWSSLGFLKGLKHHIKPNIAYLFESEASELLREEQSTMFKQWVTYMVECSDGSIYTGISNNVSKRVSDHNNGKGAKYTRSRSPVTLKWSQSCDNRSEASKLEYKIKKLSRKQKLKLIEDGK